MIAAVKFWTVVAVVFVIHFTVSLAGGLRR